MNGVSSRKSSQPLMIIAKTVKGKGVSFLENQIDSHQTIPKGEKLLLAKQELNRTQKGGVSSD